MIEVNVLGTTYTIEIKADKDDDILDKHNAVGHVDSTSKKIVISDGSNSNLENYEEFQKKTIRHELIHAFFFESGLAENFNHNEIGIEETIVDWIAIQSPKLLKAFQETGAL